MTDDERRTRARELCREALERGDPLGWFERLYLEAERGRATVPWDDGAPWPPLVAWAERRAEALAGGRTLVVGCGDGHDARALARLGARVTAFDLAPAGVRRARRRPGGGDVEWRVADLLAPPAAWRGAFDLVVEVNTLQVLPDPVRSRAAAELPALVASGGLLFVGCRTRAEGQDPGALPWPLTCAELDRVGGSLEPVESLDFDDGECPPVRRALRVWRRP